MHMAMKNNMYVKCLMNEETKEACSFVRHGDGAVWNSYQLGVSKEANTNAHCWFFIQNNCRKQNLVTVYRPMRTVRR